MQRVKDQAVRLITAKGYSAASIEAVARKAGVATGYLYRHHPSKLALVQQIYEDLMKRFHDAILLELEKGKLVRQIVSGLVDFLYGLVKEKPEFFDFMFLMLHDHSFQFPRKRLEVIREICPRICKLGHETGEIAKSNDAETVFFTLFSIPLKFFDSRRRKVFVDKKIEDRDVERLKNICLAALA